jgi:hypothetical protein
MKWKSFGMKSHPKGMKNRKYENTLEGMKMMSDGMKKYQRCEIETQDMK